MSTAEALAAAVPGAAAALARYVGRRVVVKLGGSVGPGETVLQEIAWLHELGVQPVLVHGGGPLITAWLKRVGKETHFVDGLRYTDAETLDVARMVLVGLVNTELVARLGALGAPAWGLCGADGRLLRASARDERLGLVGEVEQVDVRVFDLLIGGRYLPVVAPLAVSAEGQCLNVNADTVAGEVAAVVGASELVFLTDVPGIQDGEGTCLARLTSEDCARLVTDGVIRGGMLPKVAACRRAVAAGTTSRILDGRPAYGLLAELAATASGGTTIVA